jgi:hypothetical protein
MNSGSESYLNDGNDQPPILLGQGRAAKPWSSPMFEGFRKSLRIAFDLQLFDFGRTTALGASLDAGLLTFFLQSSGKFFRAHRAVIAMWGGVEVAKTGII